MNLIYLAYRIYKRLPFKIEAGLLLRIYRWFCMQNSRKGVVIAKRDGIYYELDLSEAIDNSIYHMSCFEPHTTSAIKKLCRQGMTVLDIGANIGAHTFRFAKLVGHSGHVFAFEPMAWAFSKLERNFQLNQFPNITLVKMGLSNESKKSQQVQFNTSWKFQQASSGSQVLPLHQGYRMEDTVDFITIDEYLEHSGCTKVDLIKIDVDGYEYKVCRGGLKTLRRDQPVVIIEVGMQTMKQVGDSPEQLIRQMWEIGYEFLNIESFKKYEDEESIMASLRNRGVSNFIMIPQSGSI